MRNLVMPMVRQMAMVMDQLPRPLGGPPSDLMLPAPFTADGPFDSLTGGVGTYNAWPHTMEYDATRNKLILGLYSGPRHDLDFSNTSQFTGRAIIRTRDMATGAWASPVQVVPSPTAQRDYLSPTLVVLPNGDYLAITQVRTPATVTNTETGAAWKSTDHMTCILSKSSDGGATWTKTTWVDGSANEIRSWGYNGALVTATGRLLVGSGKNLAQDFRVVYSDNPTAALGSIAWTIISLSEAELTRVGAPTPNTPTESSFAQAPDGTIMCLIRETSGYENGDIGVTLYTYSSDNGATWTPIRYTNWSDGSGCQHGKIVWDRGKFHFLYVTRKTGISGVYVRSATLAGAKTGVWGDARLVMECGPDEASMPATSGQYGNPSVAKDGDGRWWFAVYSGPIGVNSKTIAHVTAARLKATAGLPAAVETLSNLTGCQGFFHRNASTRLWPAWRNGALSQRRGVSVRQLTSVCNIADGDAVLTTTTSMGSELIIPVTASQTEWLLSALVKIPSSFTPALNQFYELLSVLYHNNTDASELFGNNRLRFFITNTSGVHRLSQTDRIGNYSASTTINAPDNTIYNDNNWHVLSATVNTATGNRTLYVDGVAVATTTGPTGVATTTNQARLHMGIAPSFTAAVEAVPATVRAWGVWAGAGVLANRTTIETTLQGLATA